MGMNDIESSLWCLYFFSGMNCVRDNLAGQIQPCKSVSLLSMVHLLSENISAHK